MIKTPKIRKDFGFVRVGTAVPRGAIGNPKHNAREIIKLAKQAAARGVQVFATPELGLTMYTARDLHHNMALQEATLSALGDVVQASSDFPNMVIIVGAPLLVNRWLMNTCVVIQNNRILGVVPKTHLAEGGEFEEPRWFTPAEVLRAAGVVEMNLLGQTVLIGNDLQFALEGLFNTTLAVTNCQDDYNDVAVSQLHSARGATLFVNISASTHLVTKPAFRRRTFQSLSERLQAPFVFVAAGPMESTTDNVFDGQTFIYDSGSLLAESCREDDVLLVADVDMQRAAYDRMRGAAASQTPLTIGLSPARVIRTNIRSLNFLDDGFDQLERTVNPHPFIPESSVRKEVCDDIFWNQTTALKRRLQSMGNSDPQGPRVSIGISGGLDSTLALLVIAQVYRNQGWDLSQIDAVTMPGFGTTKKTRGSAHRLCEALGIPISELPITNITIEFLRLIGHEPCYNCSLCENAQAHMRTVILFRRNFTVGTEDLSEALLGWCTYGGDQYSMYNVNASIPKTLANYIVRYAADEKLFGEDVSEVLYDVLATEISPELLPPDKHGKIAQKSEDAVGPYELNDFFMWHMLRGGASPAKIFLLAVQAFVGNPVVSAGYSPEDIYYWLENSIHRFFPAQFKRDGVPGGAMVGTVSLSPRGSWRMPADADKSVWPESLAVWAERLISA